MSKPRQPIILYGFKLSGHSHRAELLLRLLELPFEFREVDLPAREQKGAAFLKLNPFGTVPVIDDSGFILADSVAILVYLATKYDSDRRWLPADPAIAGEVQRWLSVAQGPVYGGPCTARLVKLFGYQLDYDRAKASAEALFGVLDGYLAGRRFLVGEAPTVADVAVYSYVAAAPEGHLTLALYPAIRAWLGRIEALPHFDPMPISKVA
ncbi:MAG: glutathione S-transferase [Dongiaceae bacterium]